MPQSPEDIARERIRQALESGATHLDLSGLDLRILPAEIGRLTNLTTLYLRTSPKTSAARKVIQAQAK